MNSGSKGTIDEKWILEFIERIIGFSSQGRKRKKIIAADFFFTTLHPILNEMIRANVDCCIVYTTRSLMHEVNTEFIPDS